VRTFSRKEVVVATTTFGRPLSVGVLFLSMFGYGCGITQPTGRDGGPLTAAEMTGQKAGIGLDFIITRETGAQWSMVRTCLPDGTIVYIMQSATFQRVPQYIVDNMDAVTRGQFFRDLANAGYTWMSVGAGSYFFGLTTPKNSQDLNIRGRWDEEWKGTLIRNGGARVPDPT